MTAEQVISSMIPASILARWRGESSFRSAVGNIGWLFADKLIRMGGGLVIGMLMARSLGPAQFGLLSYAGAFVSLFAALAALGLDSIVIRNIVRQPEHRDEILGTAFFLKLVGGGGVFLLSLAVIQVLNPDAVTRWLVGIGAFGTLFLAFDVIDFRFQAQVCSRFTVCARCGAFLAVASVKLYLIATGAPLVAYAWAAVAELVLAAFGLALLYRVSGGHLRSWSFSASCARRLLKDSWPLILSGLMIMVYMRIDQIMLANISGKQEVGIYAVAVALAEAWYFVPGMVVNTLYPGIVAALEESEELFYAKLQKLYGLMAFLGYLVAIPTLLLSGWVIRLLYGDAYAAAGPMLAVLIWAGLFVNLGIARSAFLNAMNWTRVHFVTVLSGAIINVCGNFLLIPRLGGMGAVLASCFAYWFAAHGACYLFKPLRRTGRMMTRALLFPRPW